MRRIHRSDVNAADLITAARKLGWHLEHTGRPTDLLGCLIGSWWPIEVKSPDAKGEKNEFTPAQRTFMAECGGRVLVWYDIGDVVRDSEYVKMLVNALYAATHR